MKKIATSIALLWLMSIAGTVYSQGNVLDNLYIKENTPNRKSVPYTPLREADAMWTKRIWRVIDLREKINHVLYYPTEPVNGRKSLFDVIKQTALAGKLTAYSYTPLEDAFKVPLTLSEL